MHGHQEILEYLLLKDAMRFPHQNFEQDGDNARDVKGMVPLHYAVLKNNFEMVKYLVEHKKEERIQGEYRKEFPI